MLADAPGTMRKRRPGRPGRVPSWSAVSSPPAVPAIPVMVRGGMGWMSSTREGDMTMDTEDWLSRSSMS